MRMVKTSCKGRMVGTLPACARVRMRTRPAGRLTTGRGLAGRQRLWNWQVLGLAILLMALAGCERQWAPRHADVAQGAALYAMHCANCHGPQGVGQNPADPFGSADPAVGFVAPALDGQGHCSAHTPAELMTLVRQGSSVPGSPMLGFGEKLSEAEQRSMVSYLFSLWPRPIQRIYEQQHRTELHRVLGPQP